MKIVRSRIAMLKKRPGLKGCPKSVFYGDPIEINENQAADAVAEQVPAQEVVEDAVVEPAATEDEAAERLATFEDMSRTERSEVIVLPPLSVNNAAIIVKPVSKGLSANNLNYLLQKALVDYPALGKVKVAQAVDPVNDPGHFAVAFDSSDYPGEGEKAFPFFRFNLSASTLNARPGGNYNIWLEVTTENGQSFTTDPYTFQRIDSTKAILGIMIPFRIIATRTLPALGIFGQAADGTALVFKVHVSGMDANGNETLTVTHPGYSTKETKVISELFSLPAGLVM